MSDRPDFPQYTGIENVCGTPFFRCGKTSWRINCRFFAELYLEKSSLKNCSGIFYHWNNGGWQEIQEEGIVITIDALIAELAVDCDIDMEALLLSESVLREIFQRINRQAKVSAESPTSKNADLIPAENILLTIRSNGGAEVPRIEVQPYTPEIPVFQRMTVAYDSTASAPQFEAVMREILPDAEDRRVAQEYCGAALFPANYTRKFLACIGEGGCGKTVLSLFLIKILGSQRVSELSIENVRRTYELANLTTQTLLTAPEAVSGALCSSGSEWVKKCIGGDFFQTQQKFRNTRVNHYGTYSLIVMTNNQLRLRFEGRGDEWRDRLIPLFFDQHISDERRDPTLVDRLLAEEGSGILNWFLAGALRVRQTQWKISLSPIQKDRIEHLLALSNPMTVFVRNHIVLSSGHEFYSTDAWKLYLEVRAKTGLPLLEENAFYRQLAQEMAALYHAIPVNSLPPKRRGFRGFVLQ